MFDFETELWEKKTTSGNPPSGLYNTAHTTIGRSLSDVLEKVKEGEGDKESRGRERERERERETDREGVGMCVHMTSVLCPPHFDLDN